MKPPTKWFKLWLDAYLDSKQFFSLVINYFGNFLCDNFWYLNIKVTVTFKYTEIAKTFFRVFFVHQLEYI